MMWERKDEKDKNVPRKQIKQIHTYIDQVYNETFETSSDSLIRGWLFISTSLKTQPRAA